MVIRKFTLPDVIGGYEVFKGKISFARPSVYAQNLIKNPRMYNTTGYTALGDTDIISVHNEQYRGIFSLYCSDSTGVYNGVMWETTLDGGQKYKFSVDVKASANSTVYLYLSTSSSQTPANATPMKSERTTGRWQRANWEFTPRVDGTYFVMVATDSNIPFHTDGWVLVATDDFSGEPETYFDGDTSPFALLSDFNWSGTRNYSYSLRRAGSGASGQEVFLYDLGFIVQGTVGLGKNPVRNIATPLPTGGGYYQDTIPSGREIALVGKIFADSREGFMDIRRKLIDLFKPDRTPVKQPILMRIYNFDTRGEVITPILEAHVVYSSGLEGSYVSDYSETTQLTFIQYNQAFIEEKDNAEEFVKSLVPSEGIDFMNENGEIEEITQPSDTSFNVENINALIQSQTGEIYAGGRINAVYRHAMRYDGASWQTLDTGYTSSFSDFYVCALKEFKTKYIAMGGNDTVDGTLKIYDRVADDVISYPSGYPNNTIYALEEKDGLLFVGGGFTTPYDYLATYNLDTDYWSTPVLPVDEIVQPDGIVRCLLLSRDKTKLFIGGDFAKIGNDSHNHIAYYDFETSEYVAMGNGIDGNVYALAEGLDGTIYASGSFATIQSGTANATYIARFRWQDADWSPLENESGWNEYASDEFDHFGALTVNKDGVLYMGGTRKDPTVYADMPKASLFRYVNSSIIIPTHYTTGAVNALLSPSSSGVWIGSYQPLTSRSSTIEVGGFSKVLNSCYVNVENMTSYPEFHIRGPGKLFAIENHTTKQTIYFDEFILYRGEHLIVKIDPIKGLTLSGIPNAITYLSAGSDDAFRLSPGENHVSISFEEQYQFLGVYQTQLQGFTLAGMNAEYTNNGQHFYIDRDYDGNVTFQIKAYDNSTVLAEGTKTTMTPSYLELSEVNNSGVSGSIWVEGESSDYTAEVAMGLASVIWKNKRWSISEDTE